MSAGYQPCIRRQDSTKRQQQITRRLRLRRQTEQQRYHDLRLLQLGPLPSLLLVSLGLFSLVGSGRAFEQYSGWTQTSRQINDEPVETTFTGLGERDGFLGCLQEPTLCNDQETCFDDSLFGRCLPANEDGDSNDYIPPLSSADANLLELEMEQLGEAGYDWSHPYTQCVLQNTIAAIQQDLPFDEADCDLFLAESNRVGDQDIVIVPEDLVAEGDVATDGQEDEDGEEEELQQEELPEVIYLSDDNEASVVPKKTPAQELSDSSWSLPDGSGVIEVDEQPDGGLLIQSKGVGDDDLVSDFASRVADISERVGTDDLEDVIPVLQQENPGLVVYEVIDDENGVDADEEEEPTLDELLTVEDFLREAVQEVEEEDRRLRSNAITTEDDDDDEFFADRDVQRTPRLDKRGGGGGGFYPNSILQPNLFDDQDEDIYFEEPIEIGSEPEEFYLPVVEGDSDFFTDIGAPVISEDPPRQRELGLGSYIFNRRGRLDVKKPGPFYPNSANNFFLDKLLSSGGDYDYNGDGDLSRNDTGQVEYEMPLVAPPPASSLEENGNDLFKPRNKIGNLVVDESPELPEENTPRDSYVHIATKRRLNTWRQGSDFIGYLAREFGLPEDALSDRTIERQHVQFHVSANPNRVDAHQMAKRIDEDSKLRERIDHQLGVEIDKAAAGHRDDVDRVLYAPGAMANFNLVLLLVVCVSSAAAVFVVATVLLLVKKRRARVGRLSDKIGRADEDEMEKARAQEEYKQLCRDWSKSGKKVDQPSNRNKPPLKGCDSNNSNGDRSSTSSYPGSEEVLPNTTNMDISTGHMVLAYMEDHLKNKQRLEQEWVGLCGYEAEPCATTVAFKAENKKKNRYPDKLPYDHNRVILNVMANANNSDYVNASTVTDHDPRNPSYIVTQAPMANTVADFWQMIWEQGCVVIVMLTRLQDNGLQLCQRYWPEEGSEQYHIFEVHLVSEHVWCDDYLVRSVYLKNTRSGETRTVTQFHFRSWPSHGVPTSTKALLEFRRKVNKSYRGRSCPIAVHCSDGVGRSGTYVLIDMVLNRMAKGCKEIDIAATLEHIRDQRGGMVQSRPQFEFCLMAVAEEVHAILKALPQ